MRSINIDKFLLLFVSIAIIASCSKSPLLDEARTNYQEAKNDSVLAAKAPDVLEEAEQEFKTINNLKKNGASDDLIEHHAYIANQKIAIAQETAVLNAKRDAVERAEQERQIVMKEYEEAEALAAKRQAEEERLKQQEAQRESDLYAQRVSELPAEQTDRGLLVSNDIHFDLGKANLKPEAEPYLANLASFLQDYPDRDVLIEGFTDNTGTEVFNEQLSLKRAEVVKQALVDMGIESDRIRTNGYGTDFAVADNSSEEGRQQNRRAEIVISDERGTLSARRPIQ